MNVLEELKTQRKAVKEENFNILNSAQKLLDYDASRERQILGDLGLDHNVKQIEKMQAEEMEIQKLEEKGSTFKSSEIRAMALKYGLRLLPAYRYKGDIDVELAAKTRRFLETVEGDYNGYVAKNNFFILAPIESFDLNVIPKPIPIPKVQKDPILFYKPNHNEDYYVVVHKWGEDFTSMRRLIGFKSKNSINMALYQFALSLIAGIVMFGGIALISTLGVASIMAAVTISILFATLVATTDYSFHKNEELWNSTDSNRR